MFIIIVVLLVGLLLLTIPHKIKHKTRAKHTNWSDVFRDILRDLGMALLVAAIVTFAYELHARSLYDRENFVSMLQSVMGKVVPPNVWREVQATVIERDRIRRDVNIRIRLLRQDSLPANQAVLWMEFGYYLQGLHLKDRSIEVNHVLDDYMPDEDAGLPRFDRIIIGNEEYTPSSFLGKDEKVRVSNDGNVKIDNMKATLKLNLGSQEKPPIRIVTVRRELIYLPSMYDIVMSELTEGKITLTIDELPENLEPAVEFRIGHPEKITPSVGNQWVFEGVMLPGQSINVRFKVKNIHSK
jgi:hypothetical protein